MEREPARLDRRAKKKKLTPIKVDPLWSIAIGSIIPNLSTERTAEFVDLCMSDAKLRWSLTEALLKRARHIPCLCASDHVEIVTLWPWDSDEQSLQNDQVWHKEVRTVGSLPHQIQAALLDDFRQSSSGHTSVDDANGFHTSDGMVQYNLRENDQDTYQWMLDSYHQVLDRTASEEGIPSRDEVGYMDDDVDLDDVAPGIQPDTVLWDAWDYRVNTAADRIEEEMVDQVETYFFGEPGKRTGASPFAGEPTTEHRQSTVWIRKPRVRFLCEML
jgi:hypothetical protein